MTYLLVAVFVSIMHETYRNIGIEKGDPHTHPEVPFRVRLKDFLMWFFAFLPENLLKRLG